ncbi:MAG: AAA family ATPase, partial [Tannerella sp.]|nr:AAA family ATPase [Tannerella sp.]
MDNKKERELPLGIQDFETLRTNNFVYVDKTQYVYQLASVIRPYFLARPRRFGKSLLLSTLRDYFLGKQEL